MHIFDKRVRGNADDLVQLPGASVAMIESTLC